MSKQLEPTINFKSLTLADWLALASSLEYKPMWAYGRWLMFVGPDVLKSLSLGDWEAIAEELGQGDSWAYYRYKEHSAA